MGKSLGAWAFIAGLVIAAIVAFMGADSVAPLAIILLAVLGIVVGLLNVTGKETVTFLVAAIAFLVTFQSLATIVGMLPAVGDMLKAFFGLMTVFIGPAAAVVAFKALFAASKN